jgi:hypothetical protein
MGLFESTKRSPHRNDTIQQSLLLVLDTVIPSRRSWGKGLVLISGRRRLAIQLIVVCDCMSGLPL